MENLKQRITEASLSRIMRHTEEGPWAILTSWRGKELEPGENEARYKKFQQDVRSLGYGFIRLSGNWRDKKGNIVSEPSLFVIGMSPEEAHRLGNKYDQEAVLVGAPGYAQLIFDSGAKGERLSKFSVRDANDMFSKWKGRKFVFESLELETSSFVGAMTEKLYGLPIEVVDDALSRVSEGQDVDAVLKQLRDARGQ